MNVQLADAPESRIGKKAAGKFKINTCPLSVPIASDLPNVAEHRGIIMFGSLENI
jgi:hypothetical protein